MSFEVGSGWNGPYDFAILDEAQHEVCSYRRAFSNGKDPVEIPYEYHDRIDTKQWAVSLRRVREAPTIEEREKLFPIIPYNGKLQLGFASVRIICQLFAIVFPVFFFKNSNFVRTKYRKSVEIKKRKPGRPGVYKSSSERCKAWRDRQKKLSANAELNAISLVLRDQMGRDCFLPQTIRLINNAGTVAKIAKDMLEMLESAREPMPEMERAFLENVVRFFEGVDALAKDTYLATSERAKKIDKARLAEMTNVMAQLVKF